MAGASAGVENRLIDALAVVHDSQAVCKAVLPDISFGKRALLEFGTVDAEHVAGAGNPQPSEAVLRQTQYRLQQRCRRPAWRFKSRRRAESDPGGSAYPKHTAGIHEQTVGLGRRQARRSGKALPAALG